MKKYGILLLLIALFVRLGAAVYWEHRVHSTLSLPEKAERMTPTSETGPKLIPNGPFFFGDSDSYWQLGRAIARGTPYQHDPARCWKVFRMPGYPTLLAPLFLIGGDHPPVFWARLENVALGTFSVFLTGWAAWLLFRKESITILALFMAAICPESIFQSVCVLSEEAFCVLNLILLIVMIFLIRYLKIDSTEDMSIPFGFFCRATKETPDLQRQSGEGAEKTKRRQDKFLSSPSASPAPVWNSLFGWAFLLGSTVALTVYFRPEWLYYVPFVLVFGLIYFVMKRRFASAEMTQMGLILFLGFLVFCCWLSPWWLRNLRVTGEFVPTTLQMGASLYDGLSPEADGSSRMDFVDVFRDEEINHPEGKPTEREFLEVRLDKKMKQAALDWAKSHPTETIRLAGVKFARLWNFWPNEPSFSALPIRLTIMISIVPILFFAAVGFVLTLRRGFVYWLLWIPALYVTALHVIFVSSLRYRSPILPGLIILAAFGFVTLIEKIKRP